MRLVWGTVSAIESFTEGIQMLAVALDDGAEGRAVNYPSLAGSCAAGERVLLNTTAVDLGLGTGGVHFVVSRGGEGAGVGFDDRSGSTRRFSATFLPSSHPRARITQ